MIDRVKQIASQMADVNNLYGLERLKIAATLILAEEIGKLATSGVGLQQAETDLATALQNISTAITNAVAQLQSSNPASVQAAADAMEAAATELNTLGSNLAAAGQSPTVSVPAGGVAATGAAPVADQSGQVKPQ